MQLEEGSQPLLSQMSNTTLSQMEEEVRRMKYFDLHYVLLSNK
jgi:hypothetical protein